MAGNPEIFDVSLLFLVVSIRMSDKKKIYELKLDLTSQKAKI